MKILERRKQNKEKNWSGRGKTFTSFAFYGFNNSFKGAGGGEMFGTLVTDKINLLRILQFP